MRSKYWIALIVAILLALVEPGASALELKGRVVDSSGKPVQGVGITALMGSMWQEELALAGTTSSAKDGGYRLLASPIDRWSAIILIGYTPDKYLGWTYVEDYYRRGGDITVSELRTLSGRVVDSLGKPVAGVSIGYSYFAKSRNFERSRPLDVATLSKVVKLESARSDAEGRFSLGVAPTGTFISLKSESSEYAVKPSILPPGDNQTLTLVPGGGLKGIVVDKQGRGCADARVLVGSSSYLSGFVTTDTTADGTFNLSSLIPGSYWVSCTSSADPVHASKRDIIVSSGRVKDIGNLILPSTVLLKGKVVDAKTELPVSGAKLEAYSRDYYGGHSTTDKQGNFEVKVVPGSVQIGYTGGNPLYAPGWDAVTKPVAVPETGLKGHVIKLTRSQMAKGYVVDMNGKPVSGARVGITSNRYDEVKSDAGGRFAIAVPALSTEESRLIPSNKSIDFLAKDVDGKIGCVASVERGAIKHGMTLRLHPTKSLRLHVKDQDGYSLPGVAVMLMSVSETSRENTDADGIVSFRGLCYGDNVHIEANLQGYEEYSADWEEGLDKAVNDNWNESQELTLRKLPTFTISGRVVDADGKPLAGLEIESFDHFGYRRTWPSAISDSDGTFILEMRESEDHYPANAKIMAIDGFREIGAAMKVDSSNGDGKGVTLVLKPRRKATVTVKDRSGKPLKGVALGTAHQRHIEGPAESPVTDSHGIAEFTHLYEGMPFEVSATLKGYFVKTDAPEMVVGGSGWQDHLTIIMALSNRVVRGLVLDNNGKPVAGGKVCGNSDTSTTTDRNGKFVLKNLPGTKMDICVEKGALRGSAWIGESDSHCVIVIKKEDL